MDVDKLVVCLLLGAISATTLAASAPPANALQEVLIDSAALPGVQVFKPQFKPGNYWVQLHATSRTPSLASYQAVFGSARVVVHQGRDRIKRVMVGPLKSYADGVRTQQRAHEFGLKDAFVRFSDVEPQLVSGRFWVQLYSTREPVNYASLIQLRSLSQIKIISIDQDGHHVLAGPFGSYQEAEAIRIESLDRGLRGAFVLSPSDSLLVLSM